VQGDSITFGEGIRSEADLYTSRLLAELRARGLDADMAVLARGGRNIDEHVQQLEKWGPEIAPDLIIYQWSGNDVEFSKNGKLRPRSLLHLPGRAVPDWLRQNSYFYFLVKLQLNALVAPYFNERSYEQYLAEDYQEGTAGWRSFAKRYQQWCTVAHQLSPRVIVLLYPMYMVDRGSPVKFSEVGNELARRTRDLCDAVYVDPSGRLAAIADGADLAASRFDTHPSELGHEVLSDTLIQAIGQQWPELFVAAPAPAAGASAP
jgi:lysophospholipase L1-like esterase